jgi:hypothetical protein
MVAEGGYKNTRHVRVTSYGGQQWDYVDIVHYYTVE